MCVSDHGADTSEFVFVSFSLTTYIISRYIICFLVFNDACVIRTGGIFLWDLHSHRDV